MAFGNRINWLTIVGRLDVATLPELLPILDAVHEPAPRTVEIELSRLQSVDEAGVRLLVNPRTGFTQFEYASRSWACTTEFRALRDGHETVRCLSAPPIGAPIRSPTSARRTHIPGESLDARSLI